jgi:hypothetical protein
MQKKYDSTLARIAGNIASGMVSDIHRGHSELVARLSVKTARAIVAELERTETPATPPEARAPQG